MSNQFNSNKFINSRLITPDTTIIVALSGGPDSTFLLHMLAQLRAEKKLTLIAAHLDHEWRKESPNDTIFCKQVADSYGITFVTKTIDELNTTFKHNGSREEIGRKARRHFLETVVREHHASAIALAHHADDQQETFFIRMMRGSSLAGLAGMKPKDGLYIRPLLSIPKQDILNYLQEHNIPFLSDPTNATPDYLRNRIRHTVIPALKSTDSRFDTTFAALHTHLTHTHEFLVDLAHKTLQELSMDKIMMVI